MPDSPNKQREAHAEADAFDRDWRAYKTLTGSAALLHQVRDIAKVFFQAGIRYERKRHEEANKSKTNA